MDRVGGKDGSIWWWPMLRPRHQGLGTVPKDLQALLAVPIMSPSTAALVSRHVAHTPRHDRPLVVLLFFPAYFFTFSRLGKVHEVEAPHEDSTERLRRERIVVVFMSVYGVSVAMLI